MKGFRFLLLFGVIVFFYGCFSSTVVDDQKTASQTDGDDFFNLANDLINRNSVGPALISLDEAYNSYSLLDDVSGKTKVLLKKANIYGAEGEIKKGDSILLSQFLMLPGRADSVNYLNSLSEYYYTTQRYDSVLALSTKFKEQYFNSSLALISTAYLALSKFALKAVYEIELSNLNKAFVALDRDQRYPGDQLSFAYYTRAYIASQEGKLDDASFWGNKAYNQDLRNEDYIAIAYDLELLARIAEKKGKTGEAAELFKRASDSYFALGIEGYAHYTEVKSLVHRLSLRGDNPYLKNRLKFLKDKITDQTLLGEVERLLIK
jgi:tetratricopeptide (TPR) repeat protein